MLCLKAEVLDDYESDNNGGRGLGFVLPLNLGTSIHRYLRKNSRLSTRSVSSDHESPSSSVSDFVDAKCPNNRSGPLRGGNTSLYKYQLQEDVKKLQQKLQEEIDLRLALASAVEHSELAFSNSPTRLPFMAQELLENIATLENTVKKLEKEANSLQYQLTQERNKRNLTDYHLRHLACPVSSPMDPSRACSTEEIRNSSSAEEVGQKVEDKLIFSDVNEDLKREYFVEKFWHHPNRLSEEMVLCMRDIFIFLADSSKLAYSDNTASPSSPEGHLSYSLASFPDSPMINSLMKSPSVDMEPALDVSEKYANPYSIPGKIDCPEGTGAYTRAVEVSWLSVGKKELEYASGALKRFRFLVEELAKVDPWCLSSNEKMAFWINVYNALIMHAFLAYGVPRSDIKLFALMQKAAYTIGGHSITAAEIEFIVLKMKPPAHRPQIALLLALQKYKITDEHKFSIDDNEPLLVFALSCGMHSSPAVRLFKPENVCQLLKTSLKDYVQASVGISSKGKLLVPKLLYCFSKVVVDDLQLPEWICQFLSPKQAAIVRHCSSNKWRLLGARSFSVLPFDSRFRFLFLV